MRNIAGQILIIWVMRKVTWIFVPFVLGDFLPTCEKVAQNTRWGFQTCFIFTPSWGRFLIWLFFSVGLKPPTRLSRVPIPPHNLIVSPFSHPVICWVTWLVNPSCCFCWCDVGWFLGDVLNLINHCKLKGSFRFWWQGGLGKMFSFADLLECIHHLNVPGIYTSIAARGGGGSFKSEKIYESKEHVPIESFVTILIDWTFVLMTPTKWASVEVMCSDEVMWLVLRWPVVS